MSDLAAYLGLYVKGNAAQKVGELEKGFERLAVKGERSMGALGRSMSLAGQGLDKLGNRYTALISGAAGAGAGKMVGDLNTEMMKLKLNAGASAETMAAFKKQMFDVARLPHISMDPTELLAAVTEVVERTGDMDYARNNLEGIGIAARATFSQGAPIGGMAAELKKFGAAVGDSFAIIKAQGDSGAFTLAKMAEHGPEMMSAYSIMGRKGLDAVREFGAMAQLSMDAVGKADVAKTSFVALINELQDGDKQKKLSAHGIKLFDPEELAKGKKVYRALPDIVRDVIVAAKGDGTKIGSVFGSEAMRAMNSAIKDYNEQGNFSGSLDKFMKVDADPAGLLKQAAEASTSFGASMDRLNGEWKKFADTNLAEPVSDLAKAVSELNPENVQATFKALAWGVGIVGGLVAVKKGIDGVRWASETLSYVKGRKGGVAGAAGAAGAVAGGPMPVIVMNWPGGGLGGAGGMPMDLGGDGKDAAAKKGKPGIKGALGRFAGKAGRFLSGAAGKAGVAAALITGGIDGIDALMEGDNRRAVGAGGRTAGALAGAAGGAAIGSVVPVLGTAAGGLIGGIAGAWAGEEGMQKLYDLFAKKESEPTKVEGSMAVTLQAPPGWGVQVAASGAGGLDIDVGHTLVGP